MGKSMETQLAGKGSAGKRKGVAAITSSSPRTVFSKKEAIRGALCPLGDGLRETAGITGRKKVVTAKIAMPRPYKNDKRKKMLDLCKRDP